MLSTERLLLRPWRDEDYAPFAAMNADPEVRRWWAAGTLSSSQSDEQASALRKHIDDYGFGFWAVEVPDVAPFIGFVGLKPVPARYAFAPAIETGWRLSRQFWGRGYATEAAAASLADGFGRLCLPEIVSFAVGGNTASRRVMEQIGMRRDPAEDFEDPEYPVEDPRRRHVLYRISAVGLTHHPRRR